MNGFRKDILLVIEFCINVDKEMVWFHMFMGVSVTFSFPF